METGDLREGTLVVCTDPRWPWSPVGSTPPSTPASLRGVWNHYVNYRTQICSNHSTSQGAPSALLSFLLKLIPVYVKTWIFFPQMLSNNLKNICHKSGLDLRLYKDTNLNAAVFNISRSFSILSPITAWVTFSLRVFNLQSITHRLYKRYALTAVNLITLHTIHLEINTCLQ